MEFFGIKKNPAIPNKLSIVMKIMKKFPER